MGNSRVRAKVRRRRVAILAAKSRQFDVKNHLRKLNTTNKKIVIMWHEIRTPRFDTPVYGKRFEVDEDGHYHLIEQKFDPSPLFMDHKQPKRLMRYKKRYHGKTITLPNQNWPDSQYVTKVRDPKRDKKNDFMTEFRSWKQHMNDDHEARKGTPYEKAGGLPYKKTEFYPYHLPKMNRVEYMEKLVEHKTAKWERKNPKPLDMFTEEVEKWKQLRENAVERIRDFVVSVYDPLLLTGRFVLNGGNSATYQEEKIAEIKDINGEGHKVNALPKDSKLIKKAQKVVNETKHKRNNLVCGNLRDHKKQKGRIILPQAA